ncbi:hypothetical protein ES707_13062 [subsurface metagenome]|jgi:polyhydroxyalkanoate synthesis regulator phasin
MSLFRKSYLKKLRADLVKEAGGDISDEAWKEVIENVEKPIIKKLQKEIPKAMAFTMFEIAEKGDCIIEIDGVDLGAKIRQLRKQKLEEIKKITKRGNMYYCTECNKGHRKNSRIGLEHECYKFVR